jgi:hypothetical protein
LRLKLCRQPPFPNAGACVTLIRQSTFDGQLFEQWGPILLTNIWTVIRGICAESVDTAGAFDYRPLGHWWLIVVLMKSSTLQPSSYR